jgi:hypothetical protein
VRPAGPPPTMIRSYIDAPPNAFLKIDRIHRTNKMSIRSKRAPVIFIRGERHWPVTSSKQSIIDLSAGGQ